MKPDGPCRGDKPRGRKELFSSKGKSDDRRERFARAIARSEFGRHYWDEGKEQELRAARTRKRRK